MHANAAGYSSTHQHSTSHWQRLALYCSLTGVARSYPFCHVCNCCCQHTQSLVYSIYFHADRHQWYAKQRSAFLDTESDRPSAALGKPISVLGQAYTNCHCACLYSTTERVGTLLCFCI